MGMINVSLPIFLTILIIWYVLCAVGYSGLLPKTGKPRWRAWIPLYNILERYDIAWDKKPGIVSLICGITGTILISCVHNMGRPIYLNMVLVAAYLLMLIFTITSLLSLFKLSICFGKSAFFAIGLILLEPVFLIILGFDRSWYRGRA